jgi:bacterioferritin
MTEHAVPTLDRGILSENNQGKREELIEMLKKAYWMEIETVMNYITNSINPDGLRAQEVIEALSADIQEELGHAQEFATRIKELWGVVPGSLEFKAEQSYLQPPKQQTDIVHVIKGVIEAEKGAIEFYNRIIEFCDGVDLVTQDMVIAILRDEEGHLRLFEGFLREFQVEGKAEGGGAFAAGPGRGRPRLRHASAGTPADRGPRLSSLGRGLGRALQPGLPARPAQAPTAEDAPGPTPRRRWWLGVERQNCGLARGLARHREIFLMRMAGGCEWNAETTSCFGFPLHPSFRDRRGTRR